MPIAERLSAIRVRITDAATAAGRSPSDIRLIAVSKTHPPDAVETAYIAGLREFGENYADELASKKAKLAHLKDVSWIFIGQLQSNKIQKIVSHADEIQSIATIKHARYVQRYAAECGRHAFPVWIVVNAEGEDTKQGVSLADAPALSDFITTHCPNLSLQGLMAIPSQKYSDKAFTDSKGKAEVPDLYKELRRIASLTGQGKLSLGMTGDLQIAIAAGSNCIRIGTAIFGERAKKLEA